MVCRKEPHRRRREPHKRRREHHKRELHKRRKELSMNCLSHHHLQPGPGLISKL